MPFDQSAEIVWSVCVLLGKDSSCVCTRVEACGPPYGLPSEHPWQVH